MASHFKWYPAESEVVVPFNARYTYPSQSNKAMKMTPRIPPKNAAIFTPGNVIRLEFPAQGYVNPGKTTLEFDVEITYNPLDGEFSYVRFQNNIQSIFNRVRLLYGATPIEDVPYYNVIVRQLTEWTGSANAGVHDSTSINEGIGGTSIGGNGALIAKSNPNIITCNTNTRQKHIHGIDTTYVGTGGVINAGALNTRYQAYSYQGAGIVPNASVQNGGALGTPLTPLTGYGAFGLHPLVTNGNPVRRYQIQLALGIFNQEKLIPTKYMASQLALELTLENASACMYYQKSTTFANQPSTSVPSTVNLGTPSSTPPSYIVSNVNLIPEILEFDASYDEAFLAGLRKGGIPIKFSTWNNYRFSNNGVGSLNLQIQERSRSVKSIFCLQQRDPPSISRDSGACFFNTAIGNTSEETGVADAPSTFQEYQYRIGGRYFPSQPVQCSTQVGGTVSNGGCEAYVELAKALNTLGDYRLSCPLNTARWATNPMTTTVALGSLHNLLNEYDFDYAFMSFKWTGSPVVDRTSFPASNANNVANVVSQTIAGDLGSSCFAMAIDLETSNGLEISGLNAEEQSDISLIARFSATQQAGFVFNVFTFIDSMIVLRENNVFLLLTLGFRINPISNLCVLINKWVISVLIKLLNMLSLV